MEQHYRIMNLHAENVKRLKVVDITPDPDQDVITITGRNGQGKTSVLDSIFWALAGTKHIQDQPIREGEERAEVNIDLGEYKIKRSFTEKGSYISVENADGFKSSSPQEMLNKLMGSITFDPLEFTRQDHKKQYETLRGLVKLDVDIEELDAASKEDFEERTVINRQAKELEAQAAGMTVPDDVPDEPVVISDLVAERDLLRQQIAESETMKREIEGLANTEAGLAEQIKELQAKMESTAKIKQEKQQALDKLDVPATADIENLTDRIQSAESINQAVQVKSNKAHTERLAKTKRAAAEALTKAIDNRNRKKTEALAKAEMPITGLSFSDGRILYNGVPFDQASNAEQIKVSTAIAMAMNPKLRVIRIKDGSLLDDESMATLRQMAREHTFQVWIERVNDDDPIAVVIEDGMVKDK